jgi:hypothetical protein
MDLAASASKPKRLLFSLIDKNHYSVKWQWTASRFRFDCCGSIVLFLCFVSLLLALWMVVVPPKKILYRLASLPSKSEQRTYHTALRSDLTYKMEISAPASSDVETFKR